MFDENENRGEENDDVSGKAENKGKGSGDSMQIIDSHEQHQKGKLIHRNTHSDLKNAEAALDWAAQRGGGSLRQQENADCSRGGTDSIRLLVSGSPTAGSPEIVPTPLESPNVHGLTTEVQKLGGTVEKLSSVLEATKFNGKHIDGYDEFMANTGMKTRYDNASHGTKLPLSILRGAEITMRPPAKVRAIAMQADVAYPGNPYLERNTAQFRRRKQEGSSFLVSNTSMS